ncbi:MAG TPA: hypothetical protein VEZ12_17450 [Herpetosiphonaceae bacterium]|nr:hypothetical protein [Herpetosiphonaceae bacterium]
MSTDTGHQPLADLMAKVAATLEIPSTVGERLHLVLEAAIATVPGVDAASISLLQRGRMETLAGTDSLP